MSEPSFAQLFRRSKYSKAEDGASVADASKQYRRELFAVAAVGFVLKHDCEFKRHFLKEVAGIENQQDLFKPEIQAEHECDLRLVDPAGKRLVVVEFKVGASLDSHQDPWHDGRTPWDKSGHFWKNNEGYGHKLLISSANCDQIWYVILKLGASDENEGPHLFDEEGKTFWLRQRKWAVLQGDPARAESPLEKDLLNSLGEIGVTDFQERYMKTIKATREEIQASITGRSVIEVLLWLCQKIGCDPRKLNEEGRPMMHGDKESFGVYHWGDCSYRWFGYVLLDSGSGIPAVGFGFQNQDWEKRLKDLKDEFAQASDVTIKHDDKSKYFECIRSKKSSLKDLDWFKLVLKIK